MKNTFVNLAIGLFLGLVAALALNASANQTQYSAGGAANLAAACSFSGATAQAIAVTGTAASSTATTTGNVRVICSTDTHFTQGLSGVTGVTATTGDTLLPANTPEYFNTNVNKFSFIRDVSSGTCYLTECK